MSENEENIRVGWIRVGEYGGGCGGVLWGGTVGRYVGGGTKLEMSQRHRVVSIIFSHFLCPKERF